MKKEYAHSRVDNSDIFLKQMDYTIYRYDFEKNTWIQDRYWYHQIWFNDNFYDFTWLKPDEFYRQLEEVKNNVKSN